MTAVSDVLDRMTGLNATETGAITQFVNTLVASGDWDNIYDLFCFRLSASDYLTGWKVNTLTTQGAGVTHTREEGVHFAAASDHLLGTFSPRDLETWNATGASAGGVIVSASSTGSNFDVFGTAGVGGAEYYFRNRTANDVQAILGSSVATPRLSPVPYPFADFYFARSHATTRFIRVGSTSLSDAQSLVPTWSTDNYVINGRNNAGQSGGIIGTHSWHFIGNESLNGQNMLDAITAFEAYTPPPSATSAYVLRPRIVR